MLQYDEIEPLMRGRWAEFFAAEIGVEVPERSKKNMPCPVCGGDDRAHFRDGEGRLFLYCRAGCGEGGQESTSPEELVMKLAGYDFPEFIERCADFIGYIDHDAPKPKQGSTIFAPIYTPTKSPEEYAQKTPRSPAEAAAAEITMKVWVSIPVTARNAVTGDMGMFPAINGNLAVPMYFYNPVKKDARPRLTAVIEVFQDGRTVTHGFSSGSFAIIGKATEDKVFCTNYVSALLVNKITGYQCIYATSLKLFTKAVKLFGVTHTYINADPNDYERINLALLAYYDFSVYLLPQGDISQTRKIYTSSYDDLVASVVADEKVKKHDEP